MRTIYGWSRAGCFPATWPDI